jgi:hypothetical protein
LIIKTLYEQKEKEVPKPPQDIIPLKECMLRVPAKVLKFLTEYDERTSETLTSWSQFGKILAFLFRKELLSNIQSSAPTMFDTYTEVTKSAFYKAYENHEFYGFIQEAMLNTRKFKKEFTVEQLQLYRQIREQTLNKSHKFAYERRLKKKVNQTIYVYKKRLFLYIFRQEPSMLQNMVLLKRICEIWSQLETFLDKTSSADPPTEVLNAMARTWHLNCMKFPTFKRLKLEWEKWEKHEGKDPLDKDPVMIYDFREYEKDIYGWHSYRDRNWPHIMEHMRQKNPNTYKHLAQTVRKDITQHQKQRQSTMLSYLNDNGNNSG